MRTSALSICSIFDSGQLVKDETPLSPGRNAGETAIFLHFINLFQNIAKGPRICYNGFDDLSTVDKTQRLRPAFLPGQTCGTYFYKGAFADEETIDQHGTGGQYGSQRDACTRSGNSRGGGVIPREMMR